MSPKSTRIMAAVSDHWLLGSLPLQDSRIRERLNDSGTGFVQLHDVEVHAHAKRECVAKLPTMVVLKRKLAFIVAPSGTHEAPEKCWNNWTAKAIFDAFAIVSEYRIQGTLHLPKTALDPQRALMQQNGKFFALTQASIGYGGRGVRQLSVPLLLANRDLVSCFEVGDRINLECPGAERHTTSETQVGDLEEESFTAILENVHALLAEPNAQNELPVISPVG
jgi:hypothetical protein